MTGLDQYYDGKYWPLPQRKSHAGQKDYGEQSWLRRIPAYVKRQRIWSALVEYFQRRARQKSSSQKPLKVNTSPVKRALQTMRTTFADSVLAWLRVHIDGLWREIAKPKAMLFQPWSGYPGSTEQTRRSETVKNPSDSSVPSVPSIHTQLYYASPPYLLIKGL